MLSIIQNFRLKAHNPKHKAHSGFTLIEILITVAILAFGLVAIYEGLFIAMDTFGLYLHYMETPAWMNEQLWAAQDKLISTQALADGEQSGILRRKGKAYQWTMQTASIDSNNKLYRIHLALSWQEGKRKGRLSRGAYALNPQPDGTLP
jgi:prepilin-type N-terminal cleavage/methylation domain-containing protein